MSQTPVMEKPCVIPIAELPAQEQPYKTINGKPYFAIWSIFILGLLNILYGIRYGYSWILGVLLIGLAVFVQWKAKSFIQFAFYTAYFVIFEAQNDVTCQKIDWDDVAEWTIDNHRGTNQTLKIRLKSTELPVWVPLLAAGEIYRTLHKRLPDLETAEKRRAAFREKASGGIFPWKKRKPGSH